MSAQHLIECINKFAQLESNPVLAVIPADAHIEQNRKYPEPVLQFADCGLRSYYHCHEMTGKPEHEHGHFHIFIKSDSDRWSHLAALTMDHFGQPIQWFTVNHWVSGEDWLPASGLQQALSELQQSSQLLSLHERWLLAMLLFYQQKITLMLELRDSRLIELSASGDATDVLQDRTIYTLSSCPVNVFNDLKCALQS